MGSLTPNVGLTVPTIGGDTGPGWANELNGDLTILDSVLGGVLSLNVGGSANVTATTVQAQNFVHNLVGGLSGNIIYFLPPTGRFYAIQNNTTGAFLLAVGVTGGLNTITIPQGLSVFIWSDGQTVRLSNPPGWTEISNTAVSGASSVNLALPVPFRRFRLTGQNIDGTNGGSLNLQVSRDGGSSFSAAGYNFVQTRAASDSAGLVPSITSSLGAAGPSVGISVSFIGPGGGWTDFTYELFPGIAPLSFTIRGDCWGFNSASALVTLRVAGQISVSGVNMVSLFTNVGTFSGTFIVEGLP